MNGSLSGQCRCAVSTIKRRRAGQERRARWLADAAEIVANQFRREDNAFAGELHGVAQKVGANLSQADRIAQHTRVWRNPRAWLRKAFALGLKAVHACCAP